MSTAKEFNALNTMIIQFSMRTPIIVSRII